MGIDLLNKNIEGLDEVPAKAVADEPSFDFFNRCSLEAALTYSSHQTSDEEKPRRKQLERLMMGDFTKPVGALPSLEVMDTLARSHPNFGEVIDFVGQQIALCRRQKKASVHIAPILLEGPPGVGKSHFARAISSTLASEFCAIDFATLTSGFALSGLHRSWSSGQMGMVAETLWNSTNMSPVFFLDELDKANTEAKSAPLGPLYTLLERHTAKRFRDEYLEVDFDLSQAVWFAAANDTNNIPQPLLSRFRRFRIEPPNAQQLRAILMGHYKTRQSDLQGFPATLPRRWLQSLGTNSVREAIAALDVALGRAAQRADRLHAATVTLMDEDLSLAPESRQRMGFF